MQLPLSATVLVPLGIGVIVVIVAAFVLARGLRRRPEESGLAPTVSDWTGESAGAAAVAVPGAAGPVTVAEILAIRQAHTGPMVTTPVNGESGGAAPQRVKGAGGGTEGAPPAGVPLTMATPVVPVPVSRDGEADAAVAPGGVPRARATHAAPTGPSDAAPVDVRDRLLAVLLDDPARAVGATMELAACQEQLARLTGAVRAGRGRLGETMTRLAGAGLRPDQLARLTGLREDEVRDLLGSGRISPRSG